MRSAILSLLVLTSIPTGTVRSQASSSDPIVLMKISEHLYQTEHVFFIIDKQGRVEWPEYWSFFSDANMEYYAREFLAQFPGEYMTLTFIGNNLRPEYVPVYWPVGPLKANGLGFGSLGYDYDFCMYTEGGEISDLALAAFDHEIGHAWGVYLPFADRLHWPGNSTVYGQMVNSSSDDGYRTVFKHTGNDRDGFFWERIDNHQQNRTVGFSDQTLYLMGLEPRFPDTYVFDSPVYNANSTLSYAGLTKYTHEDVIDMVGPREPGYQTSPKQFRLGFIFVARSLEELEKSYEGLERAVRHFSYSRELAPRFVDYRVPFLLLTKMRASVSSRLGDLDGNHSPTLAVEERYRSITSDEEATIAFEAADDDGPPPSVSCHGESCRVEGSSAVVGPLPPGTFFYTLQAEDSRGKIAYAHFVVDVTSDPLLSEQDAGSGTISFETYPNPIRTTANFRIELHQPEDVSIDLFDVRGRRVAELAQGWYSGGRHVITWEATDLPSGMYLARLQAGTAVRNAVVAVVR